MLSTPAQRPLSEPGIACDWTLSADLPLPMLHTNVIVMCSSAQLCREMRVRYNGLYGDQTPTRIQFTWLHDTRVVAYFIKECMDVHVDPGP